MGSINGWGAIATGLLAVECLIFNLIFLALAFGLWKSFGWLNGHALPGINKVAGYLDKGRAAIDKGTTKVAARPRVSASRERRTPSRV